MKKALITALAIVAFSATYADVIYWMVSDEAYEDSRNVNESANPYAWVCATTSDTDNGIRIEGKSAQDVAGNYWTGGYFETELGSYTGNAYSYYIELWNGTKTTPQSYDSLVNTYIASSGSIATPSSLSSGAFGQVAGTSYNVPEPTSGLLFLIGGMLLGLKRRRQQV
ncbi:MAG: PEP-CTERM sorting domain-containing protein [Kiritimatiellae bacterium]|nr:PEP-CTERM sorting domain-containing protein [Kiritimatiellia bacterium]